MSTGAYTSIGVSRTYLEHLASPYSKCEGLKSDLAKLNNRYIQAVVNQFGAYHQTKCFDACFADYLVDKCESIIYFRLLSMVAGDSLRRMPRFLCSESGWS